MEFKLRLQTSGRNISRHVDIQGERLDWEL